MFWLGVPLSGTDLKSLDTDVGFKSSPPQGASGNCWSPTLTMGCWAGSGVYGESVSQPLQSVLMWVLLTSFSRLASQALGFRGNCSVWSWGVRVSVDGGRLRIALWHPLEWEPLQLFCLWLKTLTGHPDWRGTDRRGWEVYGHTTLNVPNPVWGAGKSFPTALPSPSPICGLALCAAEQKSPSQACR